MINDLIKLAEEHNADPADQLAMIKVGTAFLICKQHDNTTY